MCLCDSADDVTQTSNEITAFSPSLSLPVRGHVVLSVTVVTSVHPMLPFVLRPLRKNTTVTSFSFLFFLLGILEQGHFLEEQVAPVLELSGRVFIHSTCHIFEVNSSVE